MFEFGSEDARPRKLTWAQPPRAVKIEAPKGRFATAVSDARQIVRVCRMFGWGYLWLFLLRYLGF